MKTMISIATLCLALFVVNACKSADVPPNPVPTTSLAPSTTVAPPTTTVAPVCPEMKNGVYVCYDWGPCNGLFATQGEAIEIGLKNNKDGCHRVDGIAYSNPGGGFGPCSECQKIGATPAAMRVMSIHPSFEQILKARDYSKKVMGKVYSK